MNSWQRWLKAPHTLMLRRVLFQMHLWLGIGFGLYILMISVSGSAVVLRPQFARWFINSEVISNEGEALAGAILANKVAETYPDFTVINIVPATRPRRASYVALEKDGVETSRYFDHFAGVDLGNTYPWQVRTVEWLTRLHDDLLLERTLGRKINAFGGMLLLLMVFSGLIIWWQGKKRWFEGIVIKKNQTRSFIWQLHSFLGFWSLLLMLVWGFTAIYFAFPQPFDFIIDAMDENQEDFERPDKWLLFLLDLHFGRFRGSWLAYVWVFLGLLPAVMYISGFVLWYRRVLKKWVG